METKTLPTVEELNQIQSEWMALDSSGPKTEINRVCKLMERMPKCYVSGHDGKGACIYGGQPYQQTVDFAFAVETCKALGGRTDLAWNGKIGAWYKL